MRKIGLVARREFNYNIRRPSFLFTAFGTPILIIAIWGLIFLIEAISSGEAPPDMTAFGLVDQADILSIETTETYPVLSGDEEERAYTFTAYETVDQARAALEAEDIGAYYVVPEDYQTGGVIERVSYEKVPDDADGLLNHALTVALVAQTEIEPGFEPRLENPVYDMTVTVLDTGRKFTQDNAIVLVLTPMLFGIIFFMAAQTTSQFLMNGLIDEKKNRIIDIISTTITPMQLLIGKIVGLGLLGLLQVSVWIGLGLIFFIFGPQIESLAFLEGLTVPFDFFAVGLLFFALGYFMIASFLAAVGVLAGSEQQAGTYTLIIMIPTYFVPIFTMTSFIVDPNGSLPTFLSIFPLTSPFSMIVRVGFGTIPLWQIGLSAVLLGLTALAFAWVGGRIFRWGLLVQGRKFRVGDILRAVFRQVDAGYTAEGA